MLHRTQELYGLRLAALDGELGRAEDFCFEEANWTIRYLVVEPGAWLPGRLLLLSPHAFGRLDRYENTLHLKVSRSQVQASPVLAPHTPVSRRFEIEYHRHFRWPGYWNDHPSESKQPGGARPSAPLRRARALNHYTVHSPDERLGQLTDMLVDDKDWTIRELVVAFDSRQFQVPVGQVNRIRDADTQFLVNPSAFAAATAPDPVGRYGGDPRPATVTP